MRHALRRCGPAQVASGLVALAATALCQPAAAAPFSPGSVLVTNGHLLYEYSRTGERIQTIDVPPGVSNPGPAEYARDLVIDDAGRVQCFNGTFVPWLSTLDPLTGTWTQHSFSQWSTANFVQAGGITCRGRFVYVTDEATNGAAASGIVRFDTSDDFAASRFASGIDFVDLAMSGDGFLYALGSGGTAVHVFDSESMAPVRVIELDYPCDGIALDAAGILYGSTYYDGTVHRFDSNGVPVAELSIGYAVSDIDIAEDGTIVLGTGLSGGIFLTDTSFVTPVFIAVNPYTTFVACVPGAAPTSVRRVTWGKLKSIYREGIAAPTH